MNGDPILESLRAAVSASPDDVPLRMHLAELLDAAGLRDEAMSHAGGVLQRDPQNAAAARLIAGAATADLPPAIPPPAQYEPPPDEPERAQADDAEETLRRLDAELGDVIPPMFTDAEPKPPSDEAYDVDSSELRLADVGGMQEVKERLEASFLAPLRNPELVKLYGKSMRGGLLLYGPPGCGKTFIARALAGEMGARFIAVSLADVLDMMIGESEKNIREVFDSARRHAPCVIFLDEIDALGQKRSQQRGSAGRGSVNQLLTEMDGIATNNEGVYVLGATNHPWDVDVALRRPGRFDRMIFVAPPDHPAREAILRFHLRERPIANIDAGKIAGATDGYSGADLAYVCERATELALLDAARSGDVRMIGMADLDSAVAETRPSIGPWLETASNVAQFANEGGAYDELQDYLRLRRMT